MAKQTIIEYVDDLDGSPADGPVTFALNGLGYEIDLSTANHAKLAEFLAPYIEAGRKLGRVGVTAGRAAPASGNGGGLSKAENKAIREWAQSVGIELPPRGRIAAKVVERWHAEAA